MTAPPLFQPEDVLHFNMLGDDPGLAHGIFTRRGGVSPPPFDSLNVGRSTGDDPTHVRENRRRLAVHLGFDRSLYLHQVHGTDVVVVKDFPQKDAPGTVHTADGAVTNVPGLLLVIQVADCQAVLLYDPRRRVVGALHSGWRGSVDNIIERGVAAMIRDFGCRAGDIRAGIGPSLGPCCAEFINYKEELPRGFLDYRQGAHHFDFWKISRDQLTGAGLSPAHIEISGHCTRCSPHLFFSYRHRKKTGRLAAAIGLKP